MEIVGRGHWNHRSPGTQPGAPRIFVPYKSLILKEWSGRMDLNHRPPGPEPGALARLRYAPTEPLRRTFQPKWSYQINIASRLRGRPRLPPKKTAGKPSFPGGQFC